MNTTYARKRRARRKRRWRDYLTSALLLAAIAVAAAWLSRSSDTVVEGRAAIADGDSLQIGETRIRLEGIDAPEFRQTCEISGRQSDCGRRAASHLRQLAGRNEVLCTGWQLDQFDRLLAVCHAGGIELNRRMVLDGWAVSFGGYQTEEAQARQAVRGIWAGRFERPRDWRRDNLGEMAGSAASGPASSGLGRFLHLAGNRIDLAARQVIAMFTRRQALRGGETQ